MCYDLNFINLIYQSVKFSLMWKEKHEVNGNLVRGYISKGKVSSHKEKQKWQLTPTGRRSAADLSGFSIVQEFAERLEASFLLRWQVIVVGIHFLIIHNVNPGV